MWCGAWHYFVGKLDFPALEDKEWQQVAEWGFAVKLLERREKCIHLFQTHCTNLLRQC